MSVLATEVPNTEQPDKIWFKIYNLDSCNAQALESFVDALGGDKQIAKVNFVRGYTEKIKSIVLTLENTLKTPEVISHIQLRFAACTGCVFKQIKA